ncbi:hypothetical protein TNCV_4854541 [Trichonephila clavipes]|nr:hypothetical protein TNCV_4854541 [Trichonephila clavipes]
MAPHKPRKPAPVEYSTDEEDMILYDIEEEVESTKSIVRRLSVEYWQNDGAGMHVQMLRSSGQSDAKPPVLCSQASLVLIYRPTERLSRPWPARDLSPG